jgi:hypothetical protein
MYVLTCMYDYIVFQCVLISVLPRFDTVLIEMAHTIQDGDWTHM